MEKEVLFNVNAKTDYVDLGQYNTVVKEELSKTKKVNQKIELLKIGISALDKRLALRAEERKNALANKELDEYRRQQGLEPIHPDSIKIRNIEVKKFDEIT